MTGIVLKGCCCVADEPSCVDPAVCADLPSVSASVNAIFHRQDGDDNCFDVLVSGSAPLSLFPDSCLWFGPGDIEVENVPGPPFILPANWTLNCAQPIPGGPANWVLEIQVLFPVHNFVLTKPATASSLPPGSYTPSNYSNLAGGWNCPGDCGCSGGAVVS